MENTRSSAFTADWHALNRTAESFGDPFYLLSPDKYVANCHDMRSAFAEIYEATSLAHSYKTNYLPALCQLAESLGLYAEVVSPLEYEMARRFGIDGGRIIFNGPVKHPVDLRRAFADGAMVNVDNANEAGHVIDYCRESRQRQVSVGLRVAFDIGTATPSRFGLCADSGEAAEVCRSLQGEPNCRVVGLHCHFSRAREAIYFRERSRKLIELADEIFEETPSYLNIGGGFCGVLAPEMQVQFPYDVPTFPDYAVAAATPFADRYGTAPDRPLLILEPGMGLMANVMRFVARVEVIKTVQGRRVAVCSGSIFNTQPLSRKIALPMAVVKRDLKKTSQATAVTSVAGATCMEIDIMREDCRSHVEEGDFLVFENVGAYTTVLTPPFIQPSPAIVELLPDGETNVLRHRQTVDEVLAGHVIASGH